MKDLLGFESFDRSWSWPDFRDADGNETPTMQKPAHAHASEGLTACGLAWPHRWYPARRISTGYKPSEANVAKIRDAEDRRVFLCATCLTMVGA